MCARNEAKGKHPTQLSSWGEERTNVWHTSILALMEALWHSNDEHNNRDWMEVFSLNCQVFTALFLGSCQKEIYGPLNIVFQEKPLCN